MATDFEWKIFTKNNEYKSSLIGTEKDKEWNDDFYFVLGTDPQFGLMYLSKHGNYEHIPGTCKWKKEIELAIKAVEKVNKLQPKPRFFSVCGDFTNEMPGQKNYMPDVKREQIADFKRVFSEVDPSIPLVCIPGNHDTGDIVSDEYIQNYREDFGDDYFSFWCGGKLFITLNSQYYKDVKSDKKYLEEQEQWLSEQLKKTSGNNIIVFSHIPPFTENVDEKNGVLNFPLEVRQQFLDKLYAAGVRYLFCGHYHRNAIISYKDLEIIVTSAIGLQIGSDKSGIRIVKVSKNDVSHKYFALEDVPADVSNIF